MRRARARACGAGEQGIYVFDQVRAVAAAGETIGVDEGGIGTKPGQ